MGHCHHFRELVHVLASPCARLSAACNDPKPMAKVRSNRAGFAGIQNDAYAMHI
jgi:hypothetical protein